MNDGQAARCASRVAAALTSVVLVLALVAVGTAEAKDGKKKRRKAPTARKELVCPTPTAVAAIVGVTVHEEPPDEPKPYCGYLYDEDDGDYVLVGVEPTKETPPEFKRRTWWIQDGWTVGSDPRLGDGAIVAKKSGACWVVAPPLLSAVTAVPSQDGLCEMAIKIWTMASSG